jgi:SPP1 gp7 family putative phage head morphogenesis protein
MALDDYLADVGTRRQIMIQRFANGTLEELRPILNNLLEDLTERIANTGTSRARLGQLISEVESLITASGDKIRQDLRERIIEFAEDETVFQRGVYQEITDVETVLPAKEQLQAAIMSQPATLIMNGEAQRITVDGIMQRFTKNNAQEIKNVVSGGFIAGDTTDQITQRVRQKVTGRTAAQARTVVATAVNHAATEAKEQFARQNSDVVRGEKYLATLDSRTTLTCAGFDGEIFPVGEGPKPPLHYNCRSTRVIVPTEGSLLDGLEGERPAVVDGEAQIVSGNKTFRGWLRDQPVEFRDEFFGKFQNGREKRLLFDQGGLDPNDFIDPSGAQMTLAELRDKHPLAFQQAGL